MVSFVLQDISDTGEGEMGAKDEFLCFRRMVEELPARLDRLFRIHVELRTDIRIGELQGRRMEQISEENHLVAFENGMTRGMAAGIPPLECIVGHLNDPCRWFFTNQRNVFLRLCLFNTFDRQIFAIYKWFILLYIGIDKPFDVRIGLPPVEVLFPCDMERCFREGGFAFLEQAADMVGVHVGNENDINFLKEHFINVKVSMSLKTANLTTLLRKGEVDSIKTMSELIQKLNDRPFYLEDNYIVPDKTGLIDLYNKFVKYIINYHFRKLYQLTSRSFLINQPVYNDQKDIFIRRVESLGFGDVLKKYNLKLDI